MLNKQLKLNINRDVWINSLEIFLASLFFYCLHHVAQPIVSQTSWTKNSKKLCSSTSKGHAAYWEINILSISLGWKKNERASHHRHIFLTLVLLKMPFKRIEVFLSKKYYLQQFLTIFPKKKSDSAKKPLNSGGKDFFEMISFGKHFRANLPPLTNFEKVKIFFE